MDTLISFKSELGRLRTCRL